MKIRIYGRVQGVGLRNRIKKFCVGNDIKGCVKNCSDGSVLVVLDDKNVNELVEWLEKSPGFSKVKEMKIEKGGEKNQGNFEVRKDSNYFIDKVKAFFSLVFPKKKMENVPRHVAIIPDGNRRWAKKRGMIGFKGHEKAGEMNSLISLFNEARKLGVKYISFWGFSTENWKRDKEENEKLFNVFLKGIKAFGKYAHENKIRFRHVGRKDRLSKEVVEALIKLENETKEYHDYNIQLCLDYGGRDEIIRAVNKLLVTRAKSVNEDQFSRALDTKDLPEIDLIIRTSGEKRLSGFMPYQGVYAELVFIKKHFPDFSKKDIRKALKEFSKRSRRFGGELD